MKIKLMAIFVLILVCIMFVSYRSNSVEKKPIEPDEPIEMEFTFIKTSPYDSASLRGHFGAGPAIPIMYWYRFDSWEELSKSAEEQSFIPPDEFDFENHCMLITYSRKLAVLECDTDTYYGNSPFLIVTFEEEYQEDNLFIYSIERRNYVPSVLANTSVYVMAGGERVYVRGNIEYISRPDYYLRDKEIIVKLGDGSSGILHESKYEIKRDEFDEIRENWNGLPGWCLECDEKFVLPNGTKIKIITFLEGGGSRFLILDGDIHVGKEVETYRECIEVML